MSLTAADGVITSQCRSVAVSPEMAGERSCCQHSVTLCLVTLWPLAGLRVTLAVMRSVSDAVAAEAARCQPG